MNEGTKTGAFWGAAVVMLALSAFVAWPKASTDGDGSGPIGDPLFPEFTDPLAAASLKIVTFDDEQGALDTFEVRKDRESGIWNIPSRGGYPADAVEHMKDAANSLVDLKILDIQTSNAEDHDDLGVAEPKLEDLKIGDAGVGRLVSFRDASQATLASIIIGDALKDDEEKRYVRIPGQDPVYVVKFDVAALTTRFQDWIEEDLLKLSSIDIEDIEIKDYNASFNGRAVSVNRAYDAKVKQEGTDWKLASLLEYAPDQPLAPPTPVEVGEDQQLDATKLNNIKNALDDLKIVNVARKPDGMSATLRANQDLISDGGAVESLATRGFYPIPRGSDYEILSANGELNVGLKDGVRYVMRFGNISGVTSEEDKEEGDATSGVNRYLLVTTQVDESKFPPPDLTPVPQTLEDLEAILNPPPEQPESPESAEPATGDAVQPDAEPKSDAAPQDQPKSDEESKAAADATESEAKDGEAPESTESAEPASPASNEGEPTEDGDSSEAGNEPADETSEAEDTVDEVEESADESQEAELTEEELDEEFEEEDEEDLEEESEASDAGADGTAEENAADAGSDAGQDDAGQDDAEQPTQDEPAEDAAADTAADSEPTAPADDNSATDSPADDSASSASEKETNPEEEEMTEEEKLERLEAEQEKITKENQRKIDERKDKLEEARRRVAELNARFADWYYVIPEATYSKLRIKRDELFKKPADDAAAAPPGLNLPSGGPSFLPQIPGAGAAN